ncbi:hypothetical protein Nepgr_014084 [Nepenthes gracilis]|uniref:Uncharacterized protein n=1 Tax=Nepenthes gracilis TaxID=150966 RepID=A0AAD3SIU3_NEPGR|nr:hypothetical protein Nepgr_014084 [Nepenthes gracilis]
MGEDVSKSWTTEQQKKFDLLVRKNPVSQDSSFMDSTMELRARQERKFDIEEEILTQGFPQKVESPPDFGELRGLWPMPCSLADSSMLCTSLDYAFSSQQPHTPKFQLVTVAMMQQAILPV